MNLGSDKDIKTKDAILNATLELIKEEGLDKVTLRKIAALADVNLALINYYFGSKEKLMNEALKGLVITFREAFVILDDLSLSAYDRLKLFLLEYAKSFMKYPELLREIFGRSTVLFDEQLEYKNYMKTLGLNKIKATITEITGEEDDELLMLMIFQLMAATFFPTLVSCKKNVSQIWSPLPISQQIDFLFSHYFAKYTQTV